MTGGNENYGEIYFVDWEDWKDVDGLSKIRPVIVLREIGDFFYCAPGSKSNIDSNACWIEGHGLDVPTGFSINQGKWIEKPDYPSKGRYPKEKMETIESDFNIDERANAQKPAIPLPLLGDPEEGDIIEFIGDDEQKFVITRVRTNEKGDAFSLVLSKEGDTAAFQLDSAGNSGAWYTTGAWYIVSFRGAKRCGQATNIPAKVSIKLRLREQGVLG